MAIFETWKIWVLVGGIPALVSAIIGAIWFLISKNIILKWESKENRKIEEVKGEISKNNFILRDLISLKSTAYFAAHEKRLEAIDLYWYTYLKIKKEFPSSIYLMYTILTDEEIEDVLNDFSPERIIPESIRSFDASKYIQELIDGSQALEEKRIYIEPKLWMLFFTFKAFCGRLVHWVEQCKKRRKIEIWKNDTPTKDLLKIVLTENELKKLYEMDYGALEYALNLLEIKILNEITNFTTGTKQSELYFEQIKEFNKLVREKKM